MTEHLPECPAGYVADLCTTDIDPVLQEPTCNHCVGQGCICICNRLRACEHRVRLHGALSWEEGFQEGRSSAFDAAREALDRLASDMANWSSAETAAATEATPDLTADQWMWAQRGVHRALAAIDALRDKQ